MDGYEVPTLAGDAHNAVLHRGSPIQIIAAAGSGKTEVVSQRVAHLLAAGEDPNSIVAFTFTERAAESLKRRVEQRVEARLGKSFLDRLNGCFIGTIHAYCFRLLQEHIADYENYDVLDENKFVAFLTRESSRIGFKALSNKMFTAIPELIRNVEVVENELIPYRELTSPFADVIARLDERLRTFRCLTYGQLISLAVKQLEKPDVFGAVRSKLRHLIVDEYQDVNPAQEALIKRLSAAPVELCVVGDDDQSIYQWRGSDVSNIVEFEHRYANVAQFRLLTNRRSRPTIILSANSFSKTITGRLKKSMEKHRPASEPEMVVWRAPTETNEAATIASTIVALKKKGYRYRDIAILVRSSSSYQRLLDALASHNIPVQPGGRTGLFKESDAQTFGRTFAYLVDHGWRAESYGLPISVDLNGLGVEYKTRFSLSAASTEKVRQRLAAWKKEVAGPTGPADLIGSYYDLLADCGVSKWDYEDSGKISRLGTLARCSAILADYESIRRRSRPDENTPGEMVGGQDRGLWYYRWLAIHIQNYALGAFEGFDGEEDFTLDAVDLTTIHKAKGLEWPIVFVPCVSANRFPSSNTGKSQNWHVPLDATKRQRYEGTENDERRLFYVAITRARDWLSVSTHDTPNKRAVAPSDFILKLAGGLPAHRTALPLPPPPVKSDERDDLLSITFSELANFKTCALAYRLRNLIGFEASIAPELGYGKAVHHIMRNVAEHTQEYGSPPTPAQLELIFSDQFFVPLASKPAHLQMKSAARRLVDTYIKDYGDDLKRVWAVERPFELHLENVVISGRADVILDEKDGKISSLAIVDYKTATDDESDYDTQLKIYTDAGRREGLPVKAAYVHDLRAADRTAVDVSEQSLKEAEAQVISLVDRLKARDFSANPGPACAGCDVRTLCKHAV